MVVDHSLRNAGVHEGSFPVLAHQENMATLVHSSQGKTILLLLEKIPCMNVISTQKFYRYPDMNDLFLLC